MTAPPAALELRGITKSFGPTRVLHGIDMDIRPGEVHGLLGENGCGKSTLVKVVTGVHRPDSGTMRAWGEDVPLPVSDPHRIGVTVIHQDLGLIPELSVADNIGVSSGFGAGLLAPIRNRSERARCRDVIERLELDIGLDTMVGELKPAERAGVAIARALRVLGEGTDRHVFILDEPTAYLGASDADRVIALMRSVARGGSSVVFISHRLPEVFAVTDRMTVMRDGRVVSTVDTASATHESVITDVLGRRLESFFPDRQPSVGGADLVEVDGLRGGRVRDVSFAVREGEIVGVAGLTGMGHDELPYLLAGAAPITGGTVTVAGESVAGLGPRQMLSQGVVLVPGNRQRDGGWMLGTAEENITLPLLRSYYRRGVLRLKDERRQSRALMEQLNVRPPDPTRAMASFSGGNQQKVVMAKWLSVRPRVLLMDEPTQGVDAGAKREILELVVEVARGGSAVLISSGDYEQLANVCDRVLVLYDGRIVASLSGAEISEEQIAAAAQGVRVA